MGRARRFLSRLGERGSATIEFAVIGTSYMLMLLAAFEFGYMVFIQSVLDNSARAAARLIRTGQVQSSGNPTGTFQTLLCSTVGSVVPCASIVYQAQVYANWTLAQTAVNTPPTRDVNGNYISAGFSSGTAGQIVVVQVTYNYPFVTPWIGGLVGNGKGSSFLMSTVIFKNEPF